MTQRSLPLSNPAETPDRVRQALDVARQQIPFFGERVGRERVAFFERRLAELERREREVHA